MIRIIVALLLVALSTFEVNVIYTGKPKWTLWGNPANIHYDARSHAWINDNPKHEYIFYVMDSQDGRKKYTLPERVPETRRHTIRFNPKFWKHEDLQADIQASLASIAVPNRKLKLINVEHTLNESVAGRAEYRIWPHLGILTVGTVAEKEGWEVTLYDELIEGYANMERVVEPGDVVGLSLVVTGIERGIELARQAKRLGASYVIVGNDSAIFRADQIIRLPDHPVDAVFTSNSLSAVRQFLQTVGNVELTALDIPGVAILPRGFDKSNEPQAILAEREINRQLLRQGHVSAQDMFMIPNLGLYGKEYWNRVWGNYRSVFGHKHHDPQGVKNALALFAQGCSRTGHGDVCSYCSIAGVADVRIPSREYLERLIETYRAFGIDYVFNATDSVYEMRHVAHLLKDIGAFFPEGLEIYGRAWGLAHQPDLIEKWISLTGGRLLINVGMDSGNENVLASGVIKSLADGSRVDENRKAVRNVASSGAHLHYSLIFGSPGETRKSCEDSIAFFEWTRSILGSRLDQCEADVFWLCHGSPASRVFRDYGYAARLASIAGKTLARNVWEERFYRHRDSLAVPWECEEAWYECFTSITLNQAQEYIAHVTSAMATHDGAARGRDYAFRPG